MKRFLLMAAVMLAVAGSLVVWGRELGVYVHPKDGENVVERGGQKLKFTMTAQKSEHGSVLVKMTIPAESNVADASYLRLEIVKDGKILLWTRLASSRADDGSISAGFQIHESLVKDAYVGITYNADRVKRGGMMTYLVPVAEYVTERD